VAACQRLGLQRSMSRTGSCLDNAVADSWFASLKVELVDRHHWRTRAEARTAIFASIHYNNRQRLPPLTITYHRIEWKQRHAASARYHRSRPHSPGVRLPGEVERDTYRALGVGLRARLCRPTCSALSCAGGCGS
jgi:transposase InsO family protein